MTSLSLPFGVWPKPRELAVSGQYDGISYKHDAIVLVGSGPAPSPFAKAFNPLAIERIQAGDTPWGLAAHLKRYEKNRIFVFSVTDSVTLLHFRRVGKMNWPPMPVLSCDQ